MNEGKVLITGASGFIGGNLLSGLKRLGIDAVGTFKTNRNLNMPFEYLDLESADSIFSCLQNVRPTIVIHAAAMADASRCEAEQNEAFKTNVDGTKRLIDGVQRINPLTHFVLISTDLVFNGENTPIDGYAENIPTDPVSVYGITKDLAEKALVSSGVLGFVARISLAYGPSTGESSGFLGWMIKTLAAKKPLTLFEDEWRTPVFIGDLVEFFGNWILGHSILPLELSPRIIHLGGKDRLSRYEMGLILADKLKCPKTLLVKKLRGEASPSSKRPRDVSLCCNLARNLANYSPKNFASGLQEVLGSEYPHKVF